ncbi:glycosyltransferase family 4 protein [Candidatus Peregrinibacteria bacterium]|jgi:glycosyltransferase involved in cell wall biosynthesis|nr:glycosyltransferase family 4 protein [Candidatus Peregrinibacteria bacterium]MBT4147994.1 glycosyltransferase family 4 protein [Candidatus Peregrinibacteria bacterium]MBT4366099.1 glycosyltransferase family 4 protein [Candidatus Peregrinibacteria bacterium]MBT4456243.1 glycosyltransferase family 4 protein [Candidatus Peregrinibacteria bacterium]
MKIGIDASRYSHETATGVEWYSYHIINGLLGEALKEENTDVVLYSRHGTKIPKEFEHPSRVRQKLIDRRRFWTLIGLSREMKKNPPDVLFVPSHVLPLRRPAYSVITIHDVAFKYLRTSYSRSQYWYLNWSTKYAVKNASRIIVPSEATKSDLVQFFKCPVHKIVVVPHGYKKPKDISEANVSENLKNFGFGTLTDDGEHSPYVFFVGRLESKKNLVRLIEAFKDFSVGHPAWKLVLAGKRGLGAERIIDKVRELRIEEKVIMPGYVEEDEKTYLYKNCKIFAFPSLYEGFGLPILEAFAYKKPVLTSHVSCLPEVASDAAMYCDPFDSADIARCLDKLANDDGFANELAMKGFARLEDFSWAKSVKKTFDVLVK